MNPFSHIRRHERRSVRGGRGAAPKLFVPLVLGLCTGLGSLPTWAAPALQVSSISGSPGQDVLLPVALNGDVRGVAGLMLKVRFDGRTPDSAPPLQLAGLGSHRLSPAFSGVDQKDYLYGSSAPRNASGLPIEGQRLIAIVHPEPVDGSAEVIRLPFRIAENSPAGAVYTVEIIPVANDVDGRKLDVAAATATLTVSGGVLKPGDVDGNGRVEVGDAVLTLRCVVGLAELTTEQRTRADLNGAGGVEVGDAVSILRVITGLNG